MIISHNHAETHSILILVSSEILFDDKIIFNFNLCHQLITLQSQNAYIKIMEYTNVTFIKNKCSNKLIEVMKDNDFRNDFVFFNT